MFEVAYGEFFVEAVVILFGDFIMPRQILGCLVICPEEPVALSLAPLKWIEHDYTHWCEAFNISNSVVPSTWDALLEPPNCCNAISPRAKSDPGRWTLDDSVKGRLCRSVFT